MPREWQAEEQNRRYQEERILVKNLDRMIDENESIETIREFLGENPVNLNFFPYPQYSFLYKAVVKLDVALVKCLLEHGANANEQVPLGFSENPYQYFNNNHFHLLCDILNSLEDEEDSVYEDKLKKNFEIFKIIKEYQGYSGEQDGINKKNSSSQTPLMLLCNDVGSFRDSRVISFLIKMKVDVDAVTETEQQQSALDFITASCDEYSHQMDDEWIKIVASSMYLLVEESEKLMLENKYINFRIWLAENPRFCDALENCAYKVYYDEMKDFIMVNNSFNVFNYLNSWEFNLTAKNHPLIKLKNTLQKIKLSSDFNSERIISINNQLTFEKEWANLKAQEINSNEKNLENLKKVMEELKNIKVHGDIKPKIKKKQEILLNR